MNLSQLMQADYQLPETFSLQLPNVTFQVERVLRHLPGKRLTCVAVVDEHRVVLKLFYARFKRHALHAKQDRQGTAKLQLANLPTPACLQQSISFKQSYSYLLYDYVSNAESLQTQWLQSPENRESDLSRLLALLIMMHDAGLYQHDFHFENFIIQDENWFIVDGADIEGQVGKPLSLTKRFANMAMMLAHIKRSEQSLLAQAMQRYLDAIGHEHQTALVQAAEKVRHRHEAVFKQKHMRQCTAIAGQQTFSLRTLALRRPMGALAEKALSNLSEHNVTYLKQGNSSTVMRVPQNDITFVIKRYNIKNVLHAMRRALQPTRAANAWCYGHLLALMGVASPLPLAMQERRFGVLRRQSYVVYPYQKGETLMALCELHTATPATWQPWIDEVMRLLHVLKSAKVCHGDLKATNFLVTNDGLMLLDLDGMHQYQCQRSFQRQWQQDCKRFLQNFAKYDTIHHYCEQQLTEQGLLP